MGMRMGLLGVPGLAPAGDSLFFASPKKSQQRRGEPKLGPLRGVLRCSRRPRGGNRAESYGWVRSLLGLINGIIATEIGIRLATYR